MLVSRFGCEVKSVVDHFLNLRVKIIDLDPNLPILLIEPSVVKSRYTLFDIINRHSSKTN